jgi:antitoxin MazE
MRSHVARWGNSLALRIPRRLADEAGLAEGRDVELDVQDGRLVVDLRSPRLETLLAGITAENLPESTDDTPRGAERL